MIRFRESSGHLRVKGFAIRKNTDVTAPAGAEKPSFYKQTQSAQESRKRRTISPPKVQHKTALAADGTPLTLGFGFLLSLKSDDEVSTHSVILLQDDLIMRVSPSGI